VKSIATFINSRTSGGRSARMSNARIVAQTAKS
jgi:hypothetical protein